LSTWVGPADQAFVAIGAGAKVIVASFDPAAAGLLSPTIIRTRGEVSVGSVATGSTEITGAYGMCIVTDTAFAAGAGSIPGPWSDSGWDGWFVWRSFNFTVVSATGTGFQSDAYLRHEVDSKAMRKITDDETVVLMAETASVAARISMATRELYKLS